jgi:hypothetical protein
MRIVSLGLPISPNLPIFAGYSTRPHQMHLAATKHGCNGFTEVVSMTAEQMKVTVLVVSARENKNGNKKLTAQSPPEGDVWLPQVPPPSCAHSRGRTVPSPSS